MDASFTIQRDQEKQVNDEDCVTHSQVKHSEAVGVCDRPSSLQLQV